MAEYRVSRRTRGTLQISHKADVTMLWNFLFGFVGSFVIASAIGFPIAAMLGFGRGLRGVGYAFAMGLAFALIVCRAVQMVWPIGAAAWPMAVLLSPAIAGLWWSRTTREALRTILTEHGRALLIVAAAILVIGICVCAPIVFSNAIEFEGTRNADSFTFTSSAQYMLTHTFHGAPDFTVEHPIYTISRAFFGDDAMQPRPAAEGFLAWLSALRGVDPMYLYNAVQTAGVLIAGLSVLCFLPCEWRARGYGAWLLFLAVIACSPALLHIAANSNFANALNLPAATAYVALVRERRTWRSTLAAVICVGALLSGYPEMLPFVIGVRGICVVFKAIAARSVRQFVLDAGSMATELALACVLLPWASLGTFATFKTTLTVSHANASELGGNMYAGIPAFTVALAALFIAWRGVRHDTRVLLFGILVAFALGQGVMMHRGFGYGGFKLSEYFSTLLAAATLLTLGGDTRDGEKRSRWTAAAAYVVAALMIVSSSVVLQRSWDWSNGRRVTPDMVSAGRALATLSSGKPVAMGHSPQPFYYGMWMAYVSSAPIAYDLSADPNAAGYLSPYLHTTLTDAAKLFRNAALRVDIAAPHEHVSDAGAIARFGQVTVWRQSLPHLQ